MRVQQNLSHLRAHLVVAVLFILATFWCIYMGLNVWPGIYDHDSIAYLSNAMVNRSNLCGNHWESMAYSGLLCLTYRTDFFFGATMLIQSVVGLGIFFFIILSIYRKSLAAVVLFVIVLLAWPVMWLSLFYLERDVLFALTAVIPIVMMLYLKKEKWSVEHVFLGCIILFFCGILRVEGYLFLLFFPLQLFLLKYIDFKFMILIKILLIVVISSTLFFEIKKPESRKDHYSLNATLIFASELYKKNLFLFNDTEKQIFETVIDPTVLAKTTSYYPHEAIRRESTNEALYEFQKMVLLMMFKHPILFFEHRLKAIDHGKAQFISLIDEKKLNKPEAEDLRIAWQAVFELRSRSHFFATPGLNIYKLYQEPKNLKYYWYFGHYGVVMTLLCFILILIYAFKNTFLFILSIPAYVQFLIALFFSPAFHGKYLLFPLYFSVLSIPYLYVEIHKMLKIKPIL